MFRTNLRDWRLMEIQLEFFHQGVEVTCMEADDILHHSVLQLPETQQHKLQMGLSLVSVLTIIGKKKTILPGHTLDLKVAERVLVAISTPFSTIQVRSQCSIFVCVFLGGSEIMMLCLHCQTCEHSDIKQLVRSLAKNMHTHIHTHT